MITKHELLLLHGCLESLGSDSALLYHGSTSLYFMALLHSTSLYFTLLHSIAYSMVVSSQLLLLHGCLESLGSDSALLYHGSTSLYFMALLHSTSLYFTLLHSIAYSMVVSSQLLLLHGCLESLGSDSALLYHGSTSLYLTLYYISMALLHST